MVKLQVSLFLISLSVLAAPLIITYEDLAEHYRVSSSLWDISGTNVFPREELYLDRYYIDTAGTFTEATFPITGGLWRIESDGSLSPSDFDDEELFWKIQNSTNLVLR